VTSRLTELVAERKQKVKTVSFKNKVEIVNKGLREIDKGKWCISIVLKSADCVWKFIGARHGLQEVREHGAGFEGWYWRSSSPARSSSREPTGISRVRFGNGSEIV
jgi:hypothetical protein